MRERGRERESDRGVLYLTLHTPDCSWRYQHRASFLPVKDTVIWYRLLSTYTVISPRHLHNVVASQKSSSSCHSNCWFLHHNREDDLEAIAVESGLTVGVELGDKETAEKMEEEPKDSTGGGGGGGTKKGKKGRKEKDKDW